MQTGTKYLTSIGFIMALTLSIAVGLTPQQAGAKNMGAKEIQLAGGSRGDVPFPHLGHQKKLGDCNVCHGLFPQAKGGIQKLIGEGKLKSKQVMNKHCIKCHKAEKRAGNPTGPTTCAKCHIK